MVIYCKRYSFLIYLHGQAMIQNSTTMNIFLRNTFLLILLAWLQSPLTAQNLDPIEVYEVVQGQSHAYTYQAVGPISSPSTTYIVLNSTTSNHGSYFPAGVRPQILGGGNFRVTYNSNNNTVGKDTLTIFLRKPPGIPTYRKIVFDVVPSQVQAKVDFITTNIGQTVTVSTTNNDYSNRGVLNITDVAVENNGTASINANNIVFTPNANFEGLANFDYVVCDDVGTCDKATVHVCVGDPYSYQNDTMTVITKKNNSVPILTPLANYSLSQGASNGSISTSNGILYYQPNAAYVGFDKLVYANASNGNTKTISIDVLNIDPANDFVKDDVSYTFIDEPVFINVLDNDVFGQTLRNVQIIGSPSNGTITQIANGYYAYQPNNGFEGVEEFTYSASPNQNGSNPETGVVNVIVSDLNPALAVFYLQTPKGTPLVVNYNIPLTDFDFNITSNGNLGTAHYFPGHLDTTIAGHNIVGDNLLIYFPPTTPGNDEFEITYCVANNTNCPTAKIKVDIQDINSASCIGTDCVWAGDANQDGKVDLRDLLPTGWCIGDVGVERNNASVNPWFGQDCSDWGVVFPHTGIDLKHLDANGDSLINVQDTSAISDHYNKYHSLSPEPVNFPSNIPLFLGNPDTIHVTGPGDIVRVPVILGIQNFPAENMYGLTFSIDFDPTIVDASASSISFDNESWVNYTSPTLSMVKKPFGGRIDAGYTRTNGIPTDGYGRVGHVDFVIIEDFEFQRLPDNFFAKVTASYMTGAGVSVNLPESYVNFSFSNEREVKADELLLFPNPVANVVNYKMLRGDELVGDVEVYDLTGKRHIKASPEALNGQIDVSNLTSGIYFLRVQTLGSVVTKKFEVISGR